MTAAQRRKRQYRLDPDYRARILESNHRSRARDKNPNRERLNWLASEICRLRGVVDRAQKFLGAKDRQLVALVQERERLRSVGKKKHFGY